MSTRVITLLVMGLIFTAVGVLCGWYGAARLYVEAGSRAAHSHGGADDAAAHAGAPVLSPEALKNIGVAVQEAELTSFVRYRSVAASVVAAPNHIQAVYPPVAGRVLSVDARFGAKAAAGDVLVTLVRDPIPWAELALTGDVLKPVSENLHHSMAELRRAALTMELLQRERDRLKSFENGDDDLPLLPARETITIEYELLRAERELSIIEEELERHGLSHEQIDEIGDGEIPPVDAQIWLGALKHNGYWTPLAQEIYSALPENLRSSSWAVATIAELVAGDLVDASLVEWLKQDNCGIRNFLVIGGLLQRGHDLEYLKTLCTAGALEPLVMICAPETAPDWDVSDLRVKPSDTVSVNDALVILEDPRRLYLRAEPTESEVGDLNRAMEEGALMAAHPLVQGSAPVLEELEIQRIFSDEQGGTRAMLAVSNSVMCSHDDDGGAVYRTWRIREGQRYGLRVPLDVLDKVFVFPAEAVIEEGADRFVLMQSGDGFTMIQVEVLYRDHEVAVLPSSSDIFPGNPIVVSGAFALSLALQSSGGDDAGHHGHAH